MPDGMSGLSLSEIGVSSAKKSAKVVKNAVTPFVQGAKQQVTGQAPHTPTPQGADKGNNAPLNKPEPQTANSFDIVSFAKGVKQQVTGTTSGSSTMPKASQPPSETTPKQAGSDKGMFDSMFGDLEKSASPFKNVQQQQNIEQQFSEQKIKDQQQIEALRKKLHDMYYEEFLKKAEGRDQDQQAAQRQKEEQDQQMAEQKEEEERARMESLPQTGGTSKMPGIGKQTKKQQTILTSIQPRKGSHEGSGSKG